MKQGRIEADQTPDAVVLARLIGRRHSCRGYLPDEVPRARIEEMLAIAQGAASWCNSQPWQIIVTQGEATERFREALYAHAAGNRWEDQKTRPETPDFPFPARYTGVYKERQRETGWALYRSVGVAHGDREGLGRDGQPIGPGHGNADAGRIRRTFAAWRVGGAHGSAEADHPGGGERRGGETPPVQDASFRFA